MSDVKKVVVGTLPASLDPALIPPPHGQGVLMVMAGLFFRVKWGTVRWARRAC